MILVHFISSHPPVAGKGRDSDAHSKQIKSSGCGWKGGSLLISFMFSFCLLFRNKVSVAYVIMGLFLFWLQLSWHPTKEGCLAFGTDDGKVGIFDTLSSR